MKPWLVATALIFVSAQGWIGEATASSIPYARFYAGFDVSGNEIDAQRYYSTTVTLGIADHPAANATGHLDLRGPSLTMAATNLDEEISTFAFFELFYNIEFIGPDGSVPVMVQSIGNATGGGQAALFIYPTNVEGTFYPVAFTGTNEDQTYNTNNEVMQFNANVLYTVQLYTYAYDSGTAYIDPTFTPTGPNASRYRFNTNLSLGSGTVGVVPLPASAPMFGAALLGLVAAGYGLKRMKAFSDA